eukprot:12307979-Prorocentrum_lima.AAC.1
MEEIIQKAEESRDMKYLKVLQSLEETTQTHHNAVVMKQQDYINAQQKLKQASGNHEHYVS